jgi:5-methylcytosine-specific restriction protein A
LERITQVFGDPNPGFESDPQILAERKEHVEVKDGLIAIHRLRHSMRPLEQINGKSEFERLQDMWSADNARRRWSVSFPIIETYAIVGSPKAKDVFPADVFRRIYQTQSATLRPLDDEARDAIADLEIERRDAPNSWIAIEDELAMAERSSFRQQDERNIARDLSGALEGETQERRSKITKRATWLATRFATERKKSGTLHCDDCGFDPSTRHDLAKISPHKPKKL